MSLNESSGSTLPTEEHSFPLIQRFPPNLKFINSIPSQAQKGFRHLDITFKCLDVCEQYIAVGTNIGVVYLYDRKKDKIHKLRNSEYTNPITCVKILVSLECLVAVGTKNGTVFAFKVPFTDQAEYEKFKVQDMHKASITSLEWVKNGIKLFSGDSSGLVVSTEIDHLEHQSVSNILLEENSEIVQLCYINLTLLISTFHRSLLYDFKSNEYFQVGQKDRKCLGRFGATFYQTNYDHIIYLSRPGQRIWKSDSSGTISETIILKSAFASSAPVIDDKDFQFGLLKIYFSDFLLTWSNNRVILINPEAQTVKHVCAFSNIVDVANNDDEIFVLQGFRNVVRFAIYPENEEHYNFKNKYEVDSSVPMEDFQLLTNPDVVERKESDPPNVFDWIKRKFTEVSHQENSEGVSEHNPDYDSLPDVISLNSDLPKVLVNKDILPQNVFINPRFNTLTPDRIGDEIVYKPKKGKKKKKKKNVNAETDLFTPDENHTPLLSSTMSIESTLTIDSLNSFTTDYSDDITSESLTTDAKPEEVSETDSVSITTNDATVEETENVTSTSSLLSDNWDATAIGEASKTQTADDSLISQQNTDLCFQEDPYDSIFNVKTISETKKPSISDDVSLASLAISTTDSLTVSITDSIDSTYDADCPKYGVECVQYKAPGAILSLCMSNRHVFFVDDQHYLYVSEFPKLDFKWKKLSQLADQVAVSPSENVLWVLYRGNAYSAKRKDSTVSWKSAEWTLVAKSVSYVSVCDSCVWCITWEGNLIAYQDLDVDPSCYDSAHEVRCPPKVAQIICKGDIVWVLTSDSKLFHQFRVQKTIAKDPIWKEIELPSDLLIKAIAFGGKDVVYLVDAEGQLWFRHGVDPSNPFGFDNFWQVESSDYVTESSSSQVLKAVSRVSKTVNYHREQINTLILGQAQVMHIVTSSDAGIWWCRSIDTLMYSYQKFIIGHSRESVVPKGTVSTTKWSMITAEGSSTSRDVFWGSNSTNELLCFSLGQTNAIAVEIPGSSSSAACLQSTPDSLWLLTVEGEIYIRREVTERCPQGVWWQLLDTSQLYDAHLCHISCSTDIVWACDVRGNVYARIGNLQPLSSNSLHQVWILVDYEISPTVVLPQQYKEEMKSFHSVQHQKKCCFMKVYVGPRSWMVWAMNNRGEVFVRRGITSHLLIGEEWLYVPGPRAKQLCISSNSVYLLKYSGKIYRRFGITKGNPSGDYWKRIPGKLSYFSVTPDDNLWGIENNSLYHHSSYTVQFDVQSEKQETEIALSDDDWEDVTEEFDEEFT